MKTTLKFIIAFAVVASAMSFQLIKTRLNVTVRDELGNTVEGASVQLFETEEDFTKEQNVAAQGVTDAKGMLSMKELKGIVYYVIVRKGDKDNAGAGEQTGKLEANRINRVTIVIE